MEKNIDINITIPFMKTNKTYPLGGIIMIEKVEKTFGMFEYLFEDICGKTKDLIPRIKFHVYNKLTHSVSVHQMLDTYTEEVMEHLGMNKAPRERSLYRTLERVGKFYPIILERYQQLIKKHKLIDKKQIIDFSSTYLEGKNAELGELGYTRDNQPGKLQINFGISTGINNIPTAITIHKGNTQDKKLIKEILKVIQKVIPEKSLLIFDAGANTMSNKEKIIGMRYNYLTRKQKKTTVYQKYINYFIEKLKNWEAEYIKMNDRQYYCVKTENGDEILYVFFCPELYDEQIKKKEKKFVRQKAKGNKVLKKRKKDKIPSDKGWVELIPQLQKTLFEIDNPYINGTEGFFILESSINDEPEKILKLYKERDKAEKFIRALKEGLELRPVRHWTTFAIIGIFIICFLANFLINLTVFLEEKTHNVLVKNVKLLKKYLINLTLTVVYPKNRFRFHILSNVSPQILSIFGDYVWRYEDKSLDLRW